LHGWLLFRRDELRTALCDVRSNQNAARRV
jgi:hypothetical protein